MTPQEEAETVVLKKLQEAYAALMSSHDAAFRAGFMGALEEAARSVEHVRKLLD